MKIAVRFLLVCFEKFFENEIFNFCQSIFLWTPSWIFAWCDHVRQEKFARRRRRRSTVVLLLRPYVLKGCQRRTQILANRRRSGHEIQFQNGAHMHTTDAWKYMKSANDIVAPFRYGGRTKSAWLTHCWARKKIVLHDFLDDEENIFRRWTVGPEWILHVHRQYSAWFSLKNIFLTTWYSIRLALIPYVCILWN